MTLAKDLLKFCDEIAPLNEACEWDNCGLLCGDDNQIITKALVCLDITKAVINEAKEKGCQLIISHHPVIFSPLHCVTKKSLAYELIKSDITAICLHTNLDIADKIGVNVCLANTLELKNAELFKEDFLCIGELSVPMCDKDFAVFVKEKLHANGVRYTKKDKIKRVGVCSGAGSDAVEKMLEYNLDALVTGEVKHHHFLYANENSLCVVEAGHFNTENVVVKPLADILQTHFTDITFYESDLTDSPVMFV